ncbi:tyrosine-protein phosphatase [Nocardia sp. NBC_00403]|uniref:tyrosine-protein phosphatase n=1 Tax=Nocardia sp. NBC_00403 TaxID=2975990 RepID=UPI002E21B581
MALGTNSIANAFCAAKDQIARDFNRLAKSVDGQFRTPLLAVTNELVAQDRLIAKNFVGAPSHFKPHASADAWRSGPRRWWFFDAIDNFRDVGGLMTHDGRSVRYGVLFRSGTPQCATDEDVVRLLARGIGKILDLRSEREAKTPGNWPGESVTITLSGNPDRVNALHKDKANVPRRDLPSIYRSMPAHSGDALVAALREMLDTDGATLAHCLNGRDRTAFFIAVPLDAIGVKRSAIMDDYLMSDFRTGTCEDLGRKPVRPPEREAMQAMFDALDEYGGAAEYLRAHGFTDSELAAMSDRLLTR